MKWSVLTLLSAASFVYGQAYVDTFRHAPKDVPSSHGLPIARNDEEKGGISHNYRWPNPLSSPDDDIDLYQTLSNVYNLGDYYGNDDCPQDEDSTKDLPSCVTHVGGEASITRPE
ncbi:hypothetical protein SIIN_4183_T [Serendipita indica DSM 11827]|nr:hypothetical protein SIIN_4183_T [Serendipita indica DSM 11827]